MQPTLASILGATWGSLGALLIGVGAALLVIDAMFTPGGLNGMTFGGTISSPGRRLSFGAATSGTVLVAVGSAILLFSSSGLILLC